MFDATFFLLAGGLAVLVSLAWLQGGGDLVNRGLSGGSALLLRYALVIAISFLVAGYVDVLLPHELLR